MNRVLAASLIALAAGGAFALWLFSGGPPARGPTPEQDAIPAPEAPPRVASEPVPTTGTLVLRVRVADGTPVPAAARAGYERFGVRRLRPPGADGTYRFTDVPVGPLEVLAETPGRRAARSTVTLVPGVAAEVILLLPAPEPGEVLHPPGEGPGNEGPGGMSGGGGGEGGTPPPPEGPKPPAMEDAPPGGGK